ncbi:MAG: AAA family ATPase [Sedimenticola sp.]
MLTNYDRAVRFKYICNLMNKTAVTSPIFSQVLFHLENTEEPSIPDMPTSRELREMPLNEKKKLKQKLIEIMNMEIKKLSRYRKSEICQNVTICADYFKLSKAEKSLFEFVLRKSLDGELDNIYLEYKAKGAFRREELFAIATGTSSREMTPAISQKSKLFKHMLVKHESAHRAVDLKVPDNLLYAMDRPSQMIDEIRSCILGECVEPRLSWSDFSHVGKEKDLAVKLIANALRSKEKGINILLYGPPGTGKTEFCKTLAKESNARLYAVTDLDDSGDAANGRERLEDLMLKQQWIPDHERSVILFDEMEDIGLGSMLLRNLSNSRDIGGKSFFNRLLEENPHPVLWTCNDTWWFDEAFLRRMSLAIELKTPPRKHMKEILLNSAEKNGYELRDELAEELSSYDEISPGIFANSLRVANIAGEGDDGLKHGVTSIIKAMNCGAPVKIKDQRTPHKFRQDISNTDIQLHDLSRSLEECTSKGFSLCLYGPPGTGKSAYARFLASAMELDVLFKRGSDLLSKFVGGTEKNIARAFEEAMETESFLIIDEADSFLQDRSGAHRSWEVTQVNEVLTWLESHPLPVAFTTNNFESLDSASLRRFTFKVKFGYLNQEQIQEAFEYFFGICAPKDVNKLELLTPGDFANVQKKAKILGLEQNAEIICKMLTEECELKPGHKNPIGFEV